MEKKYTNLISNTSSYIIGLILILLMIPVTIPVNFTSSGYLKIYLNYFLLFFTMVYFLLSFYKLRKGVEKPLKLLCIVYIAICGWYVIVTFIRLINKLEFYKSMEIAYVTLTPISIFLLILLEKIQLKKCIKIILTSVTFINIISTIYHLIILKSLRSDFLVNINIIVLVSIMVFIFNMFCIRYRKQLGLNIKYYLAMNIYNIIYCFVVFIVSGSRLGLYLGLLAIILVMVISLSKDRGYIKVISISFMLAIVVAYIFISKNIYNAAGLLDRASSLNTLSLSMHALNEENQQVKQEEIDDINIDVDNTQENIEGVENSLTREEEILIENDKGRFNLWKQGINEIVSYPIYGSGEISFELDGAEFKQTAHNFIIEYGLVYGGIGLILWILFGVVVVWLGISKFNKDNQIKGLPYFLLTILFVCAYSFFQPTLSSIIITSIFWIVLGIFVKV